jgi:hypothetical protein
LLRPASIRVPSGIDEDKNILVENIEYSTIPVHTEQARALNIHPKIHYEVQNP